MKCQRCGSLDNKVVESRDVADNDAIRRRRECLACGYRFTTYERLERPSLVVVKRNGAACAAAARNRTSNLSASRMMKIQSAWTTISPKTKRPTIRTKTRKRSSPNHLRNPSFLAGYGRVKTTPKKACTSAMAGANIMFTHARYSDEHVK